METESSERRLAPRRAIRTFCRWCNGGDPESCTATDCPLYPLRLPQPAGRVPAPLRSIHAYCLTCLASPEEVRTCAGNTAFDGQTTCPLWPHRLGKRLVNDKYRSERREQALNQRRESGPEGLFVSVEAREGRGLVDYTCQPFSGPLCVKNDGEAR